MENVLSKIQAKFIKIILLYASKHRANSFCPRNSTYYSTYIKQNLDPGKYIFEAYDSQWQVY